MPPADLLLAFAVSAFLVVLIPGPTVLLVTGYALSAGRHAAMLCILGVCLGDMVAMTLTFLGLGTVLATSAELFSVLKWLGALYLVWLGIRLWPARPEAAAALQPQERHPRKIIARAFAVNVLHPKGLAFYTAFLPQFIDTASPPAPQMLILGIIFTAIAFSVLASYALAAAQFRAVLHRPFARHAFNRAGAACLIGAGAYTATLKQAG